ncbi:MAG: hypothetical protein WCZ23_16295 [Rhodospirillaceae bacterium]
MPENETYLDRFTTAVDKSDKWECTGDDDFEPPIPQNVTIKTYLEAVDHFIDQHPFGINIRTACAPIHFNLWHFLRYNNLPSIITIGDIAWKGKRQFQTSYSDLKREWRGAHTGSNSKFNAHVWLTLPSGDRVIDLSALPYLMGEAPQDFNWKNSIFISNYVHSTEPLEHIPYLVGVNFLLKSGVVEVAHY